MSFDIHSTFPKSHRVKPTLLLILLTWSHTPLQQRPYHVSAAEHDITATQVNDMLQHSVITLSSCLSSSPVVLVRKKDGSIRFCMDYRRINKITQKDAYPLPRIDDAINCLQGAKYSSSLDLRSGYWQVPMAECNRPKTEFVMSNGLYEFTVMMDSILRFYAAWSGTCVCVILTTSSSLS